MRDHDESRGYQSVDGGRAGIIRGIRHESDFLQFAHGDVLLSRSHSRTPFMAEDQQLMIKRRRPTNV
ncbi:hypothetical protein [Paraburkholderia sp. SOS3]|uniref:hypothetical protein n=1 Tax=Paraburkholderia sp. SOS3 TaxID=1926494 RepID=UPI001E3083EA|nr:hypothetical protein [Paraburkholderia sp. SOS3]